jgi:hypothetical protein
MGTPPGYWLGAGIGGLGTSEHQIEAGGTVSEEHLSRLLGEGHDPITGQLLGLAYYRPKSIQDRAWGPLAAKAPHRICPSLPPRWIEQVIDDLLDP